MRLDASSARRASERSNQEENKRGRAIGGQDRGRKGEGHQCDQTTLTGGIHATLDNSEIETIEDFAALRMRQSQKQLLQHSDLEGSPNSMSDQGTIAAVEAA